MRIRRLRRPAYSRAHRSFRGLSRFEFARQDSSRIADFDDVIDAHGIDQIIGIYVDPETAGRSAIVVSEDGLLIVDRPTSKWVRFDEIASTVSQPMEEMSSEIRLILQDGSVAVLSVTGRNGRFRDVFAFIRFLDRVLDDIAPSGERE